VDTVDKNFYLMTGAERHTELYSLLRNTAESDFAVIHQHIEVLVGRHVFNTELVFNSARLLEEARQDSETAPSGRDG
jgi:hypothetical protein